MPNPREFLAQQLKQARLSAGYATQGDLAEVLHVTRSLVAKAESPNQPAPSLGLLKPWADATKANLKELEDLFHRSKAGSPDWLIPYLGDEQQATIIRCWGPLIVPGLGQTEPYARSLLSVEPYTPEHVDELARTRMDRQGVLDRAHVTLVIDARVLQVCVGSPQVMAEQCRHVANLAELTKIVLHVVPEGANVGTWGGFAIASRGSVATVNLTTIRDVCTNAPDMVDETVRAYDHLLGHAMPRDESLNFTREQEELWKQRI